MINSLYVLAIIPARGGSKGLPGKNIIGLNGKPLIAYTIEAASGSKYVDRVIVSTDSDDIAKVSRRYGADVPFRRPSYLATDTTHTPPVIEHAVHMMEKEGLKIDLVVILQPTSPLRQTRHIDGALELFRKRKIDSAVGVKPASYPPYWIVKVSNDKVVPFVDDGVNYFNKERQQLVRTYQINGAIYVTRRDALRRENSIITKNCGALIMDNESSLDIDTREDLEVIEKVMKRRKERKR